METSPSPNAILSPALMQAVCSGLIGGTVSTVVLQPLDVIKTRLQSYHDVKVEDSNAKRKGIWTITRNIIVEERASTLWRGLTPSLWRTVPGVSLYFTGVHLLTSGTPGLPSSLQAASAGLVSRTSVAVILAPFTVVKTRFESKSFHYKSVWQALCQIWQAEGVKGLWSGTMATLVRDAPYSALHFMFYTQAKALLIPEDVMIFDPEYLMYQLGCGVLAGTSATLVTQPADIVKTRMQLLCHTGVQSTLIHAIQSIYQDYGIVGFVQGFIPRVVKRTLMSAISWTIFEQMTKRISYEQDVRDYR